MTRFDLMPISDSARYILLLSSHLRRKGLELLALLMVVALLLCFSMHSTILPFHTALYFACGLGTILAIYAFRWLAYRLRDTVQQGYLECDGKSIRICQHDVTVEWPLAKLRRIRFKPDYMDIYTPQSGVVTFYRSRFMQTEAFDELAAMLKASVA